MQKAGKLLDLAPVLGELSLTDKFPASTVSNFSTDKVIFGVPYQGLLTGLWYNKKVLADNGLDVPVTFDDLINVAKTLSAKGITTISNGANQSSFSVWSFLVDLDRFGYQDKIQGILAGTEKYNNADFLRLYQHIAELRDAGAFASNVSTQTYQQAVDQFTGGNAAMLDAGVWASSAIQDAGIDAGFWAGPQFSDGVGDQKIVMNVASAPFAVAAKVGDNAAKLAAVKKFIAFYYSDEAQQLLVDNGQPPVTTYAPQVDAAKQGALKAALDTATAPGVTSPETQPDLIVSTAVASAMYDSIYGVIQAQLTPQAALELVQKAFDAQ
jgi:raffinose/stachyose/melibiose transport system substrate-binding protein